MNNGRRPRRSKNLRVPVGPSATARLARHAGIEAQCAALAKLARHLMARGVDDWARTTANAVLRFFDRPVGHAEVNRLWVPLRVKLMRIRDGESQWIRRTEVQRFVRLYADVIDYERRLLLAAMAGVDEGRNGHSGEP